MELTLFEKRVQLKRKLIEKHKDELLVMLADCPHDHLEKRSQYYSGTYYDRSYTEYWNECRCCGATSQRTTDNKGYYG